MAELAEVRQPKLLTYCAALYERFLLESEHETVEGTEMLVWRGKLVTTATDVGIPPGTYKRVMDQLKRMSCVEQITIPNQVTAVILHRPPTPEVWQDEIQGRDLTRGETPAILSRRIEDMERRLEGIDIKQALVELQQEVDDCKTKIKQLQDDKQ